MPPTERAGRYRFERRDWRLPPAQLRHIDLELRIFDDRIEGVETLFFEAREEISVLALDAQELEIGLSERLEGAVPGTAPGAQVPEVVPLASVFDKKARRLSLPLGRAVPPGGGFAVRIRATCRPTQNVLDGAYFDVTPPGAPPQIVSQCQQWGFQRIMPIVDDCTAKCTWRTALEGSARYTHLVTNGDVDRSECPDGRPVPLPGDPSRVRIVYRNDTPMPPYLFLVAAGTWDCLADSVELPSGRTVRLEYLVPPGSTAGARVPMDILKRAAVFQARFTGCGYGRECYRTICMEKSNFGGMENVGNTTIITEAALLDEWTPDRRLFYAHGVIVHEFEHNHCGSGVTMRTPFDMWLNEAYTVTVERAFVRESFGESLCRLDELDGLRDGLRGPLAAEDGGASAPVVRDGFDSPDDVVDGVTYDKAPEILGMLSALVGRGVYESSMAAYFARHDGGNVDTSDFLAAFGVRGFDPASAAPGAPVPPGDPVLARFFREWLFTTGYPRIRASWKHDPAARRLSVKLSQKRSPGSSGFSRPFVVPLRVRGVRADGSAVPEIDRTLVLENGETVFGFENVAEAPAFVDWNSGLPFYGTISDDTATPETLALAARVSPFPIGRVEAARALATRAAAGDADAADALFAAMESALDDGGLDPAVRAALLSVEADDLDASSFPAGPARAVAARGLRRAAARRFGFDRLRAAFDAAAQAPAGRTADAAGGLDPLSAGLPLRSLRRAVAALLAATGDDRANAVLEEAFESAGCIGGRLGAAAAAVDGSLPVRAKLLDRLRELCKDRPGAFAAYLALVGSDPDPDSLFGAVAAAESDPSFRPEHPGHARSLYAAVSRNAEALWTERGLAWFREKLVGMAAVNENVSIAMLGAVQDWRRLPDPLRSAAEALLRSALAETAKTAPGALSLPGRIRDLLGEPAPGRTTENSAQ